MLAYIVRRLLLIVPTLIGIMVINFVIVQAAAVAIELVVLVAAARRQAQLISIDVLEMPAS